MADCCDENGDDDESGNGAALALTDCDIHKRGNNDHDHDDDDDSDNDISISFSLSVRDSQSWCRLRPCRFLFFNFQQQEGSRSEVTVVWRRSAEGCWGVVSWCELVVASVASCRCVAFGLRKLPRGSFCVGGLS